MCSRVWTACSNRSRRGGRDGRRSDEPGVDDAGDAYDAGKDEAQHSSGDRSGVLDSSTALSALRPATSR